MSALVVKVTHIEQIKPHGNADALDIAVVGGWQCVVRKGEYRTGEKVVYFPPDTMLPAEVSDRFGVTKYLSNGRIRCARLRGEPSFGLVVKPDEDWAEETDVAAHYGATKYVPPVKVTAGDAAPDHALFPAYTDVENLRNYPAVLAEGEPVVVTEKIHGTNCRVGVVEGERMAGSKALRRRPPGVGGDLRHSTYWMPFAAPEVATLLDTLGVTHRQVVLFGEVFGPGVQSFNYGQGEPGFRAFDLLVDGSYLDHDAFLALCSKHGVQTVPEVARVPFSLEAVKRLSSGPAFAGSHIREGVVVKPVVERHDPALGRVILKYVSDEYLLGQHEDFTDR
jgi:RNA ligase (TIGR02306 family)